jgi:hypothetical protein
VDIGGVAFHRSWWKVVDVRDLSGGDGLKPDIYGEEHLAPTLRSGQ